MNSFSCVASMLGRGGMNVNSMNYINRYSKSISADFSGSSFIDLSNTNSYAVISSGLNMTNGINGNTFARLKNSGTGTYLKTADFNSTGSFTIYLKHAARFSSLSPLNFQYPNVVKLSNASVSIGSSFTATFYSSLYPGTTVPYVISGCSTTDLGIGSLNGTFTSPYQSIIYTVLESGLGKTIAFNVSGGINATLFVTNLPLPAPLIQYTFETVNGSTVTNSGSAGASGNGTLFSGSTSLTYSATENVSGLYSMNNSLANTKTAAYVRCGTVSIPDGFTFAVWIYIQSISTSGQNIFFRFSNNLANLQQSDIVAYGLSPSCYVSMNRGADNLNADHIFMAGDCFKNRWMHVAFSMSSQNIIQQYINGTKMNSSWTYNESTRPTTTQFFEFFRASATTLYYYLNGYVDDYRVYNGTLSDSQVQQMYTESNPIATLVMPQLIYLKAYYKLNDISGSTSISNEVATTGAGTTGAGVTFGSRAGATGMCAVFNLLTTSYITLPSSVLNNTDTGTIMMWVMPTASNKNLFSPGLLFSKAGTVAGTAFGMLTMGVNYTLSALTSETTNVSTNYSTLYFMVNKTQMIDGITGMAASTTNALTLHYWHHIAVTFTRTQIIFYINGVVNKSVAITVDAATPSIPDLTNQTYIGSNQYIGSGTRSLSARMNGFASWNTVLSASEILGIYNVL